ncbi:uncharacterized protein LOC143918233 [Arctopsyche grandis]|uniref:uncharacterized protein LOC143918233 n=1 Tax=Arctopsyche grandis TaxID=121162 RepID=UPI00406D70E7
MQRLFWICFLLSIANYAGGKLDVTKNVITYGEDNSCFPYFSPQSAGNTYFILINILLLVMWYFKDPIKMDVWNVVKISAIINKDPGTTLFTATQIAMSGALVVGILTIFVLFWKICTASYGRRPQRRRNGRRGRTDSRSELSIDSLQQVVIERLRDAPPPYTRSTLPPPGDTPPPYSSISAGVVNPCFDPDCDTPPPTYSSVVEQENAISINERRSSNKSDVNLTVQLPKEVDGSPDPTLHI